MSTTEDAVKQDPKELTQQQLADIISDDDWQAAKPKLAMFSTLVQAGIPPAQAVVESGMALQQPNIEIYLEKVMYDRILHPQGRILNDFCDLDQRKPGDLVTHELYMLVDMLHYSRSHPLHYIASTLNIPVQTIFNVKKEIADQHFKLSQNHNAETYVGDYMRRAEMLVSRVQYNETKAAPGSQNRLNFLKMQFEILNKILDRQQEFGKIPKNLGTAHIKEEYVVEVRSGGIISNRRVEQIQEQSDTTIQVGPEDYTVEPASSPKQASLSTDTGISGSASSLDKCISIDDAPGESGEGSNGPGKATQPSCTPDPAPPPDPAPFKFCTESQMSRISDAIQKKYVQPSNADVDRRLQEIIATKEGPAFIAGKIKHLGKDAQMSISIDPPEDNDDDDHGTNKGRI